MMIDLVGFMISWTGLTGQLFGCELWEVGVVTGGLMNFVGRGGSRTQSREAALVCGKEPAEVVQAAD